MGSEMCIRDSYMTGEVVFVDGGRMALNYTMPPVSPPPGRS